MAIYQLNRTEAALLRRLRQDRAVPIVRLELRSSREPELISTALPHVWLETPEDGMEPVKKRAAALAHLEELGLIRLCYDLPVTVGRAYQKFECSRIFFQLKELVAEGSHTPGFLFDLPFIKRGVARITSGR